MKLDDFEYELLKFVRRESLISNGDRVLLAVSGGADSVAMMYAFSKIKDRLDADFFVAHLNHMIRQESVAEAEHVKSMADAIGMECFVGSRNVPEYIQNHKGLSLEEAARIVRYDFFDEIALKHGATKIATAHHLSDLAENFFIRLFRGSGIGGLVGMSPINGKYIKPFLIFDEQSIRKYVKINRFDFFEDRTNFDTRYLRNRIRHVLIPKIKAEFCPDIEKSISNTSRILRNYQDHVDREVGLFFDESLRMQKDGTFYFDLKILESGEELILSEFFKMIFGKMHVCISNRKVNSCVDMIRKNGDHELDLGNGIFFLKSGNEVRFGSKSEKNFKWNGPLELLVPGEVKIEELSVKIYSELRVFDGKIGNDKKIVTLDAESIIFPLVVRSLKKSESIVPFGMKEEVKVRDILKNNGVFTELREQFPVVSQVDGRIIWIVGMNFPDDLKVTKKTNHALILTLEGGV